MLLRTRVVIWAIALFILSLSFCANYMSIRYKSVTYDEPAHLRYGIQVLKGNTDRFDDSKMPVTALNAAPLHLSKKHSFAASWNTIRASRVPTLIAAFLLGLVVLSWSWEAFGWKGGLLSLLLYVFDPNVQAHARWVTTDLYAACAITLALYLFWRFCTYGGWPLALLSATFLALSQLAKFSAVYLYPIFILLTLLLYDRKKPIKMKSVFLYIVVFAAVTLIVLNLGYLGNGSGIALKDYAFKSTFFQGLQKTSDFLSSIPIPLPQPFVSGLDWVKFYEVSGQGRGPAYLWGQTSLQPFSFYYAWVFLYKVPLAMQVLFAWALFRVFRHWKDGNFWKRDAFLFIPILFYFVYFNFISPAQMGIRMMLMIFPLFHILCGILLIKTKPLVLKSTLILIALLIYIGVSMASYYPHWLSYFNELVGSRKYSYQILADSNLDWGQNDYYVKQYKEANSHVRINPIHPVPGRIVVSANFLNGIVRPETYAWYGWIKKSLYPVDTVAYSHIVFDIPSTAQASIQEYLLKQKAESLPS